MVNYKSSKEKVQRVHLDFEKELKAIAKERYMKDLDIKEQSFPEMTRIIRTTPSWMKLVGELKTLPHKDKKTKW